ncbi:MAG: ATP-binding protein [Caldilineaceae bacterium]
MVYTIADGTPPVIVGDVTRLRQVLLNLVGNGIKFTEAGEVFVEVTSQSLGAGRHRLQFAVRDTGIGIPEDRMDRLFQSFSQVDASTTRRFGGTGLGLAISKQLVELMGGLVWVESQAGVGSTFFFTIECDEAAQPASHILEVEPSHHKGARILVVDDNATNRAILNRQLLSWGMQPTMAASGNEALSLLALQPPFDLILLDMQMPEMDGVMLAQSIYRKRSGAHGDRYAMPMIMLSSIADQLDNDVSFSISPQQS